MNRSRHYWLHDKDVPFAFLLTIVHTYLHPELGGDVSDLREYVNGPDAPNVDIFKAELRQIIKDPSALPEGALFMATEYETWSDEVIGSANDEAYLAWLWPQLYGDEPVDA